MSRHAKDVVQHRGISLCQGVQFKLKYTIISVLLAASDSSGVMQLCGHLN